MHTGILLHLQQKVARHPVFVRPDAHTTGDAVPCKRISVTGQVQDSPIPHDDISKKSRRSTLTGVAIFICHETHYAEVATYDGRLG